MDERLGDAWAEDEGLRAVVARAMFGPPGDPMVGPDYRFHRRRAGEVIRSLVEHVTAGATQSFPSPLDEVGDVDIDEEKP